MTIETRLASVEQAVKMLSKRLPSGTEVKNDLPSGIPYQYTQVQGSDLYQKYLGQAKELEEKNDHIKELSEGWERTHQANQKHQREVAEMTECRDAAVAQRDKFRAELKQYAEQAAIAKEMLDRIRKIATGGEATTASGARVYTCDKDGHSYMGRPRMCARCGKVSMDASPNHTEYNPDEEASDGNT